MYNNEGIKLAYTAKEMAEMKYYFKLIWNTYSFEAKQTPGLLAEQWKAFRLQYLTKGMRRRLFLERNGKAIKMYSELTKHEDSIYSPPKHNTPPSGGGPKPGGPGSGTTANGNLASAFENALAVVGNTASQAVNSQVGQQAIITATGAAINTVMQAAGQVVTSMLSPENAQASMA